jgi:hypothetical protein
MSLFRFVARSLRFSGARLTSAFSSQAGGLLLSDAQYELNFTGIKPRQWASATRVSSHRGAPWVREMPRDVGTSLLINPWDWQDLATSDFHPFVASAGADGSCMIVNVIRRLKRQRYPAHWSPKVYRMDFNRRTGEFRMVDNIHPEVTVHSHNLSRTHAYDPSKNDRNDQAKRR